MYRNIELTEYGEVYSPNPCTAR